MDTSSGYKIYLEPSQGSHSHNFLIFLMEGGGGGPRDFLGLEFWPKGIFLGLHE